MTGGFGQPGLSRSERIVIALVIGLAAGLLTYGLPYPHAGDFTYWWRATRAMLAGIDPYSLDDPTRGYPDDGYFMYPLPAAIATIPFAWLTATAGKAAFVGAGFALAAYGLSRDGLWRLLVLFSPPALYTLRNGQWSPLLVGAALVPTFHWLLACKPTIGAALFAYRLDWRIVASGVGVCVIALVIQPTWPLDWLSTIDRYGQSGQYRVPLAMPFGFLLLLAWLRWREPEGRLIGAMALVPQNAFFYEQLPMFLVARTPRALAAHLLVAHVAWQAAEVLHPRASIRILSERSMAWEPFVIAGVYLPALIILFLQPRTNSLPDLPRWLRRVTRFERTTFD